MIYPYTCFQCKHQTFCMHAATKVHQDCPVWMEYMRIKAEEQAERLLRNAAKGKDDETKTA